MAAIAIREDGINSRLGHSKFVDGFDLYYVL